MARPRHGSKPNCRVQQAKGFFHRNPSGLVLALLVENMPEVFTYPERLLEADAIAALPQLVARHGLGARLLLVCDDATWVAAGEACVATLGAHHVQVHSLGRAVKASLAHAEAVAAEAHAMQATGLVAVGSGTLNDITKYAAYLAELPYLVVATAASMNGYSSANASLEVQNHKQSFAARSPKAVLADTRVIAHAPKRLTRAGIGDTLCRSTVAADRYLSHVVFGTPFERAIFDRLRAHEPWLLANAALTKESSLPFAKTLMQALLDAGDAMTEAGSSAVASQGEHMIAHTLEQLYGGELRDILHGELVAVTTVTMAHLQHKMLLGQLSLRHLPREHDVFYRFFGREAGSKMIEAYARKIIPEDQADAMNAKFQRDWPEFKAELLGLMVPANGIERMFMEVGLATKPDGLGLMPDRYNAAMSYAYLTRERFTFLDLAAMNARRASGL